MNIMMLIANIFSAAFTVIITYTFFYTFLGQFKPNKKRMFSLYLGLFILICSLSFFTINPLITSGCIWAAVFVIANFYKAPFKIKLFSSLAVNVLFILIEIVVAFIFAVFSSKSVEFIVSDTYFYFFGVLISKTLTFIVVKSIQLFKMSSAGDISYKTLFSLLLMPLATVLIIYVIYFSTYDTTDTNESMLVAVAVLMLIISNIFIIYIFERQIKQEQENEINILVQQQLKLQKDYFQELSEKQKLSNKAIHDAKSQLYAIKAHLNSDGIEYAAKKMNELCENVFNTINISNTGNDALDALINSKYKKINENNIEFSSNIFMSAESEIDDVDLCILIGNALDNAIEACERIGDDDAKWIKLKIMQIDDNLSIELINTSPDDYTVKNQALHTIKNDKYLHGFGLKSMREITNKYDGDMEYFIEDRVFHLNMFIPVKIYK